LLLSRHSQPETWASSPNAWARTSGSTRPPADESPEPGLVTARGATGSSRRDSQPARHRRPRLRIPVPRRGHPDHVPRL